MGLTENQKRLIMSISNDNLREAKKVALVCLAEDTTAKNEYFCSKYKQILESTKSTMLELPSSLKELVSMEDVTGFNENRYYLPQEENDLYKYIRKMFIVSQQLTKMNIRRVNTTLLYGKSGTGKTMFGRYVAYRLGLPFCYLTFSGLVGSYMGETSKNLSKVFNFVRGNPCVLMLDELDCISTARGSASESKGCDGEISRTTITIMQELDSLPNDVVVLGATNRLDIIDEAILRRFIKKHEVLDMSVEDKVALLRKYFSDVGYKYTESMVCNLAEKCISNCEVVDSAIDVIVDDYMRNLMNQRE